jgi:hypothetical protein
VRPGGARGIVSRLAVRHAPAHLRPLLAAAAALALAGCGGSGSSGSATTVTNTVTVTQGSTGTTSPTTAVSGQTTSSGAQNLVVTNAIRAQLLGAGAALHKLPVSDYTGLVKGQTYYALDPATGDHWAGAALIPSKDSKKAQIGNQDDGAYLVYRQTGSGPWRAWDAGIPGNSNFTCAVTPPASVLAAWNWAPGACHPRSGD